MMKRSAIALVATLAITAGPTARAQTPFSNDNGSLAGRASVIDGDTLEVSGQRVRLHGVDAPESRQTCSKSDGSSYLCGNAAARFLDEMLIGKTVFCTPNGRSYDRLVAVCRVEGRDVGAAMVAAGWAIDVPKHSRGRYANDEIAARAENRGMWIGDFQDPADFRAQSRGGGFR